MSTTPPLVRPWRVVVCAVCRRRGDVIYRPGARESAAITQERRSSWIRYGELVVCPRPGCREVAAPWAEPYSNDAVTRAARTRALVHEVPASPADAPRGLRWIARRLRARR